VSLHPAAAAALHPEAPAVAAGRLLLLSVSPSAGGGQVVQRDLARDRRIPSSVASLAVWRRSGGKCCAELG
jgi:hypothetical protein